MKARTGAVWAAVMLMSAAGFCDTFTLKDEASGRTYGPFEVKEGQDIVINTLRLKIAAVSTTGGAKPATAGGVEALLKDTPLPTAMFHEATPAECIDYLKAMIRKSHRDSICNIVLRGKPTEKITLELQKVNAYRVLQEICAQLEYKMEISEDGVTLSPQKK